ncbi:MAG: AAA family ATPase, partial [Candidatus Margulisbacteria bacterium]|nr:AAA family ATPase [Candidatus Margulisiibacteriota bacterium]
MSRSIDLRERVLFRDQLIGKILTFLEKRHENSPVLVGDAGVGKTAIAEEIMRRLLTGQLAVKEEGIGRIRFNSSARFLSLDLAGLQSLRTNPPALEAEIKSIETFIENEEKEGRVVILWLDEIHLLPSFAQLDQRLKEATGRGSMQIMGATTYEEYRRTFEKDAALQRRFPAVVVEPLSKADSALLLHGNQVLYETTHGVRLQGNHLLAEIVRLAHRFLTDRVLPGSAVSLMDHGLSVVAKRQERMNAALVGKKGLLLALLEQRVSQGSSPELDL